MYLNYEMYSACIFIINLPKMFYLIRLNHWVFVNFNMKWVELKELDVRCVPDTYLNINRSFAVWMHEYICIDSFTIYRWHKFNGIPSDILYSAMEFIPIQCVDKSPFNYMLKSDKMLSSDRLGSNFMHKNIEFLYITHSIDVNAIRSIGKLHQWMYMYIYIFMYSL